MPRTCPEALRALIVLALASAIPARAGAAACELPPAPAQAEESWWRVKTHAADAGSDQVLRRDASGFWAPASVMREWRLPISGDAEWQRVDGMRGLALDADACSQTLTLDLSNTRRARERLSLRPSGTAVPALSPVAPGGFFNLDLQHSGGAGAKQTAGLLEAGLFNAYGRGGNTVLAKTGGAVRLDSFWQIESPDDISTLRFGDSISRSGAWGRSLRFAGLQWGHDFSLQPYLPLFPQPSLRGEAALPSTLDVFVDGQLRGRSPVDAGPFELDDIPAISGAGEAVLVARDLLGRETRVVQPFYVSPSLLREGLDDYGLDVGWQRRNYSFESNDYRDFFAATTLRHGFSNRFTGELRAELGRENMSVGFSGLKQVGRVGVLSSTVVFGADSDNAGALAALGFEREVSGVYSWALRSQWTQSGFRQLGQIEGQLPSRRTDFARFSFRPHPGGSLSLLWTHEDARDRDDIELRALSYGLRLGPSAQFDVSVTQTCTAECVPSALANLSWTFGARNSAFAQADYSSDQLRERVGAQGNPDGSLGWGWRASAEHSDEDRADLGATWSTTRGIWNADLVQQGDLSYRLGGATGVAFLGGEAFWTRPVTGSFAVVDVGNLSGVDVFADRRLVGRTDENGRALVPDLRAYEINNLSLDIGDIPIEANVDTVEQTVVPSARSGVMAVFPVESAP